MKQARALIPVLALFCILSAAAQAQKASVAGQGNEPPERVFGAAEKILGYDAPPPGAPNEETQERAEAVVQYPDNASMNYRGVVFGDFNAAGSFGEEFVADFGSAGVWVRDGSWHQISGLNPSWMIGGNIEGNPSDEELVAGFGSYGVWTWSYNNYPGTWNQVSGALASGAFLTDDNNDGRKEVYVDFASLGLWRYDAYWLTWTQMSSLNAYCGLRMNTIGATWEEACALFPTYGVWRIFWNGGAPYYEQLSGTVTSEDDHACARFTGGTAEDLVVDFGTLGLWLCKENDQSWHQIVTGSISRVREVYFIGNPDAELLIRYNTSPAGLWMWNYGGFPGTLTQLNAWTPDSTGFVEPFDTNGDTETNGDQEVAVDFGANGLWVYDNTDASWTQISALNPVFMVAGDYWKDGYKSTLVVDFGTTYGLWRYRGGNWDQLSGLSPDSAT